MFYDFDTKQWLKLSPGTPFEQSPHTITARATWNVKASTLGFWVCVKAEGPEMTRETVQSSPPFIAFLKHFEFAISSGHSIGVYLIQGISCLVLHYSPISKEIRFESGNIRRYFTFNEFLDHLFLRFATICNVDRIYIDHKGSLAHSFLDRFLSVRDPGTPVTIRVNGDTYKYLQWSDIPKRWKLCIDLGLFVSEETFCDNSMLLARDDIYDIRKEGNRIYTQTSFHRALAYQTTYLYQKPEGQSFAVEGSPLGHIIHRAQERRLKQRELCRIAVAFRVGKAWLDNGRFRLGRDVGSLIAHYILRFQSSVIQMDIVTPSAHDPAIRRYKSDLRHGKHKKRRRRR